MDVVLVPVGRDLYAVPIGWVREVVSTPRVTPLVTAPATVLGLFNLRGEIVPLVDTAALLGVAGSGAAAAFAVVLHTHLGPVGLSATGLPRRTVTDDAIDPSELRGSAGRYRVGGEVAVLLDVEALLDSSAATVLPALHGAG